MTDKTMTLEQVLDWHRKQARACGITETRQDEGLRHEMMADAITRHISKTTEHRDQVAEVYRVPEDWGRYNSYLSTRLITGAQVNEGDKLYTTPPSAIDIAAMREVIADLLAEQSPRDPAFKLWADKLARAIGDKP